MEVGHRRTFKYTQVPRDADDEALRGTCANEYVLRDAEYIELGIPLHLCVYAGIGMAGVSVE